MEDTDLIVQLLALAAVIAPIVIQRNHKNTKLQRSVYLMELMSTRDQLRDIIKDQDETKSPGLVHHLTDLATSIEADIEASINHTALNFYPVLIAIQTFVGYNLVHTIVVSVMKDVGLHEGILRSGLVLMVLWGGVFALSAGLTFFATTRLKRAMKNYWALNFSAMLLYNGCCLGFGAVTLISLLILDVFTRAF